MSTRHRRHSGHEVLQITLIASPHQGCGWVGELTHHNPTPRFQHPIHLTESDLRIVDVAQAKADGHRVKTSSWKGQRFGIPLDELNIRISFSTLGDHSG